MKVIYQFNGVSKVISAGQAYNLLNDSGKRKSADVDNIMIAIAGGTIFSLPEGRFEKEHYGTQGSSLGLTVPVTE